MAKASKGAMEGEREALVARYRTALQANGRPSQEIDAQVRAASDARVSLLVLQCYVERAEWAARRKAERAQRE